MTFCHFLIFIDGKSIKVMISGFNFKKNEKKIARWRCGTKISKTNIITMISTIDKPPGVSKNPEDQIKYPSGELESSNLFKFEKPSENRVFPVGIGSQGVPCELYRVWDCSVGACQ